MKIGRRRADHVGEVDRARGLAADVHDEAAAADRGGDDVVAQVVHELHGRLVLRARRRDQRRRAPRCPSGSAARR